MRNLVVASAIFLGSGIVLEILVQIAPFGTPSVLPALLSALAAFSVLFAAALLSTTFLVSLLPSVARQLRECQH
jgi:hypothetical protein